MGFCTIAKHDEYCSLAPWLRNYYHTIITSETDGIILLSHGLLGLGIER